MHTIVESGRVLAPCIALSKAGLSQTVFNGLGNIDGVTLRIICMLFWLDYTS